MNQDLPTILILRPLNSFGIVTAELKRVMSLGRYMTVKGKVMLQYVDEEQEELKELVTLCEELTSDSLYAKYANKKVYRHTKNFWDTTETIVRQHVKQMADIRLLKAIRLTAMQDIPILYAAKDNTPLHITDR
jgi:hypothetical protein